MAPQVGFEHTTLQVIWRVLPPRAVDRSELRIPMTNPSLPALAQRPIAAISDESGQNSKQSVGLGFGWARQGIAPENGAMQAWKLRSRLCPSLGICKHSEGREFAEYLRVSRLLYCSLTWALG